MQRTESWKLYRTKYLVKAKKLSASCKILDSTGRVLVGESGDYLVESSDGSLRIARRDVFEDVYVELEREEIPARLHHLATAS
jgi:hypothetical protein